MAKIMKVKMVISTGYIGADHETEYEFDAEGLTEKEIDRILEEEEERFMWEEIDVHSTFINEEELI